LPHFSASQGSRLPRFLTGVQSHSLFRSYRAVLPTSLTCVIFSPKVTCLRDRMRLSVRYPPVTHQLPFMEYENMHTASYPVALLQCPPFWSWALQGALYNYMGTIVPSRCSRASKLCSALPLSGGSTGVLARFPFNFYFSSRLQFRTESPAVCFSGCGILLYFGGRHAGY